MQPSAQASPIVYEFDSGNFSYGIMPDLNSGGTVTLGGNPGIFPTLSSSSTVVTQNLNQDFAFEVRYYPTGAPQHYSTFNRGNPLYGLVVTAHLTGSTDYDPNASYVDRVGGGFTSSITSVVVDPSIGLLHQPGDLPQPLLDLLQHPERIHLSSPWQLGRPGTLPQAYLTIDPANPVPEPTTLATITMGLGGLALLRLWKRGR
jgi:hypothetical protein